MNFNKIILMLFGLLALYVPQITAVGGGLGCYRYNSQGELEFLLVKDPTQRQLYRQGFEFPAGTIGDRGHRTIDGFDEKQIDQLSHQQRQALSTTISLRGAVREALEELVYIPVRSMLAGRVYSSWGSINEKFSKKAIDCVSKEIIKQGLVCLSAVNQKSNYTIFFWDVTAHGTQSWLSDIALKRASLTSGLRFNRASSIGAEPDEFAWVNAQDLIKIIQDARATESNISRVKGQYFVFASEHIKQHKYLEKNKKIKLSPGFVGLISKNYNNDIYHRGDGQGSSMLAVIKALS